MLIRSALFWDITQSRVVILYRRFGGQPIGPIFKRQKFQELTDTLSRNVGKRLTLDALYYPRTAQIKSGFYCRYGQIFRPHSAQPVVNRVSLPEGQMPLTSESTSTTLQRIWRAPENPQKFGQDS